MTTRLSLLVLPFLVCCGGSSSDHPEPSSDASVRNDAHVDASSTHDAGTDDQGGDDGGDDQTDDDGGTAEDSDAGACAGPTDGTWQDSANSVKLTLNDDCSVSFMTPTCTASGTSTPVDSATGTATLQISTTTGDSSTDGGVPYPCFDKKSYVCIFQEDQGALTYYCMGTGVAAPGMLSR